MNNNSTETVTRAMLVWWLGDAASMLRSGGNYTHARMLRLAAEQLESPPAASADHIPDAGKVDGFENWYWTQYIGTGGQSYAGVQAAMEIAWNEAARRARSAPEPAAVQRDARGFPLVNGKIPVEAVCAACQLPMVTTDDEYFLHDCDCMNSPETKDGAE